MEIGTIVVIETAGRRCKSFLTSFDDRRSGPLTVDVTFSRSFNIVLDSMVTLVSCKSLEFSFIGLLR